MEEQKILKTEEQQTNDDFIMLPTVDTCFVGLMENERVRKSVCAAALGVSPETIGKTILIDPHLKREYIDGKLGILDARVLFTNGDQMNLETRKFPARGKIIRNPPKGSLLMIGCRSLPTRTGTTARYSIFARCWQIS